MRLRDRVVSKLVILVDTEILLESVLVFAPDYREALYEYASVLVQRHKYLQAIEETNKLLQLEPRNPAYRTLYGNACGGLGRHEEALQVYRELLVDSPQAADLILSIGHALKTLGRQTEAIESY